MKYLKQFTLIMLMALMGIMVGYAQERYNDFESAPKPDTIRLQMPNKVTIEFRTFYSRTGDIQKRLNFEKLFHQFMNRWKVIDFKNMSQTKPIQITCTYKKFYQTGKKKLETNSKGWKVDKNIQFHRNIQIKSIPEENKIFFPSDKKIVLPIIGKNQIVFKQKYFCDVIVYFNNEKQLQELEQYNLKEIIGNADSLISKDKTLELLKLPYNMWLQIKDDNSVEMLHKSVTDLSSQKDYLVLISPSVNLGYVKDRWTASFQFYNYWHFSDKSKIHYNIGIGYEMMFDYTNNKHNINHWIDVSFREKRPEQNYSRYNLYLGYLIKKQGDLFKKNTFRFGVIHQIKNTGISVTPQLYFEGFFKKAYPGVKIGISF